MKRTQPGAILPQSALLNNIQPDYEDLMEGVGESFPIVGIRGSKFWERWQGEENLITIPGTPHPAPFIDVVILKAQRENTRTYYASGYIEGSHERPDCWSSDGVKPDDAVPNKINDICATCPFAEFGSSNNAASPRSQACQQRRRTVVVYYGDDLTGGEMGPMLLSVPPASLKNQKDYGKMLKEAQAHYFGCVTRLSFEAEKAYPKLEFTYIQPLNDQEVMTVLEVRESEGVKRIMTSQINVDGAEVVDAAAEATAQQPAQPPAQPVRRAPTAGSAVRAPINQQPTAPPVQQPARVAAPAQQPMVTAAQPAQKRTATVATQASAQQQAPARVGGYPATAQAQQPGTIAGAVARPAPAPVSRRTVATPPQQVAPPQEEAPPPTEADMEGEAMQVGPDELNDQFGALMEIK
jgi:hypothetical protein